jgi:hypothetical protein
LAARRPFAQQNWSPKRNAQQILPAARCRLRTTLAGARVYKDNPGLYLKIATSLVPRELLLPQHITIDTQVDVNEEQLARLADLARLEMEKRAQARAKAIEEANANQGELVVYKS